MGYKKLNMVVNGLCLGICLLTAVVFLLTNTILGYVVSALFFVFSCYTGYYFYRIMWLRNWGRPLSEEKKRKREQYRKQMRDYQRYNIYNRLYRFADATEIEYQAEKAKEELKKNSR
jgi:O-antigen/teichoic acid export membrane protein